MNICNFIYLNMHIVLMILFIKPDNTFEIWTHHKQFEFLSHNMYQVVQ